MAKFIKPLDRFDYSWESGTGKNYTHAQYTTESFLFDRQYPRPDRSSGGHRNAHPRVLSLESCLIKSLYAKL
jgi:hypothetical protein